MVKTESSTRWVRLLAVAGLLASLVAGHSYGQQGTSDVRRLEQQLAFARKLLTEVERSPSANLDELRTKLHQARAETGAVLKESPQHPEALKLLARINSLLGQLAPRARSGHPMVAEAEETLDRLVALIKGAGPRSEIEELHIYLRKLAQRLEGEKAADAARYNKHARELWEVYAIRLANIENLCPGCPPMDVQALATGFNRARAIGVGDYELEDLVAMRQQGYMSAVTGDFNRDGSLDVALIGRGRQKGKEKLFFLIASRQKSDYRRLFLQPLDWDKAALAASDGTDPKARTIILGDIFHAADDYYTLRWNGRIFVLRYASDEMGGGVP